MADISTEDLKTEINTILKTADLTVVSAKKIREQVEKKLKCSLLNRKKEFDSIVMDFINQQQDENEEATSEDEDSEEEVSEKELRNKPVSASAQKKRPQPTQRKAPTTKKKRKSLTAADSGTESDGSDSDYKMPKKTPMKKKSAAQVGPDGTTPVRRVTGFTRAYSLSPELSELMGTDSLPRHEVVKKVWAMIKEKNLYDPKNKQFAICDDALLKVMKVKRFRTFGMLKHLKPHFIK